MTICRWQKMVLVLHGVVVMTAAVEHHIKPSQGHVPRFAYGSNEQKKPYSFEYEVDAPHHGTWHDRREQSSGYQTRGQFRVALPDNRLQTVTYRATHGRGFQADVHFQQHPDFPTLRGNIGKAPAIGQSVVPVVKAAAASSGIMYPTASKLPTPKFDYKPSVGNEHKKGRTTSFKAVFPAPDNYRRPVQKVPQNPSAKDSYSSHSAVPSKPQSKFVAAERTKTNHFTLPGASIPRPNFVPSRHTIRPVNSKSLASRPSKRPAGQQTSRRKILKGKTVRGPPSRVKPSTVQSSFSDSASPVEGVPVPHVPNKPPKETIEPPATKDESFNLANKERGRYKIRREDMESVRSRLNGIVHS